MAQNISLPDFLHAYLMEKISLLIRVNEPRMDNRRLLFRLYHKSMREHDSPMDNEHRPEESLFNCKIIKNQKKIVFNLPHHHGPYYLKRVIVQAINTLVYLLAMAF